MTDQPPAYPPPSNQPPAYQPASQQPPAAYPSAPNAPASYGPPAADTYPGKTLGIVALVLSCIFFFGLSVLAGLILGIVARVQSNRAGRKNGPALAAIIIASVLIVLGILLVVVIVVVGVSAVGQACGELGPGVHELSNGTTVTCS